MVELILFSRGMCKAIIGARRPVKPNSLIDLLPDIIVMTYKYAVALLPSVPGGAALALNLSAGTHNYVNKVQMDERNSAGKIEVAEVAEPMTSVAVAK